MPLCTPRLDLADGHAETGAASSSRHLPAQNGQLLHAPGRSRKTSTFFLMEEGEGASGGSHNKHFVKHFALVTLFDTNVTKPCLSHQIGGFVRQE